MALEVGGAWQRTLFGTGGLCGTPPPPRGGVDGEMASQGSGAERASTGQVGDPRRGH